MTRTDKVDDFLKGFQQGQDFADQLEGMSLRKPSALLGMTDKQNISSSSSLSGGRYWENHYDDGAGFKRGKDIFLSLDRPPLGPVTFDDGVTRVHAPTELDPDPLALPSGKVLEPVLREARRKPEAKGNFDEAAKFMYDEMSRSYNSIAARALAAANKSIIFRPQALMGWAALVWPGSIWDHKPMLSNKESNGRPGSQSFKGVPATWFRDGKDQYGHDVWSNIHYGYIGRRGGFDEITLLAGAGGAQLKTLYGSANMEKERSEAWNRVTRGLQGPRGFDDPLDASAIKLGMHLYDRYGAHMTLQQLKDEVRSWPGIRAVREPAEMNVPGGSLSGHENGKDK